MKTGTQYFLKRVSFILLVVCSISLMSLLVIPVGTVRAASKSSIVAITFLPNHQRLVGDQIASPPNSIPKTCLGIFGGTSNVSRNQTYLSYDAHAAVQNNCGVTLLNGGGWQADFQVDCAGNLINENPLLDGGLPQINSGVSFTFLDGHWDSTCEDGPIFYPPDEVTIYLSASGNLQGGGIAVGSSYIQAK
ncbi:MAG: hypothetical protein WCD86_28115 [Ktedonobacteraceae bacterium]